MQFSNNSKILFSVYAFEMLIVEYNSQFLTETIAFVGFIKILNEFWFKCAPYKWRVNWLYEIKKEYLIGNVPYIFNFLKWAMAMPSLIQHPLHQRTSLRMLLNFGVYGSSNFRLQDHPIYLITDSKNTSPFHENFAKFFIILKEEILTMHNFRKSTSLQKA